MPQFNGWAHPLPSASIFVVSSPRIYAVPARADRLTSARATARRPVGGRSPDIPGRCLLLVMAAGGERDRVSSALGAQGFAVMVAADEREIAAALDVVFPGFAVVFWDRKSPSPMNPLRRVAPAVAVLVLPSAHGEEAGADAAAFRAKLVEAERVLATSATPRPSRRLPFDPFVGRSKAPRPVAEEARIPLGSESPVLIEGETGSGKGVLAEWLHRQGTHRQQPFIDLNCAGCERELLDSELLGHERGAFTGAVSSKPGLIEVAEGGTLFLDEIGDMESPIQAKLLKVIEEKRFRRIGERHANVRIIAATHRNLLQLVRDSSFREDLYYRIGVLSLRVPPLRRRREDLAPLVDSFLHTLARDLGRPTPAISRNTSRILLDRAWPGNLRELRNTLERAILAAEAGPIEPHHLGRADAAPVRAIRNGDTLLDVERAYIERVLVEEPHVERAARRLGMARSTLYQKLQQLGIRRSR